MRLNAGRRDDREGAKEEVEEKEEQKQAGAEDLERFSEKADLCPRGVRKECVCEGGGGRRLPTRHTAKQMEDLHVYQRMRAIVSLWEKKKMHN